MFVLSFLLLDCRRFHHEDGSCTSTLAAFNSPGYGNALLAVGTESGVESFFDVSEVVSSGLGQPKQFGKSVMNLTTRVDVSCFHPSGEIFAMASSEVSIPPICMFVNVVTNFSCHRKLIS